MTLIHGYITIVVKRGIKLKNMDYFGKSDPYVIVELDGHQITRTHTVQDGLNPEWEHSFSMHLCSVYRMLKFSVFDEDDLNSDDQIGHVTIACEDFLDGGFTKIFDLHPSKSHGQLEISIKFVPWDKAQTFEVPNVPFPLRQSNQVVLYQKAHMGDASPIAVRDDKDIIERSYQPANCWIDVARAIFHARKFIYITGWSVWVHLKLVRQDFPEDLPREWCDLTLGEMLKSKCREGLRVLLLVWNEATSSFGFGGLMMTHDEETKEFFNGTGVKVNLAYRKGQALGSEFIWTHHQKSIILDAPIEGDADRRRIIAFVGGLDLTDGRYDTPRHSLFGTLKTHHHDDFHQVWKGITSDLGPREPWHDIHSRVEGPVARDVLSNFIRRWKVQAAEDVQLLIDFNVGFISEQDEAQRLSHDHHNWNVQFFRSIDEFSSLMVNPEPVEKSIQMAYIHHIRRAKHFLYIENQYFLGSSQCWLNNEGNNVECHNLIPAEIAERIVAAIHQHQPFCAYILLPMYPEGIPEDGAVQEILYWQWQTIKMMYKKVHNALVEEGLHRTHTVEDYLNFYCLGQREALPEGDCIVFDDPTRPEQKRLLCTRRFMVYVHSKMMIVDDEYIILGSANINERSMAGDRDTEIAVGCYQPSHIATPSHLPRGDVHAFRLSLWATHTGVDDSVFQFPQTADCARRVNQIAEKNWSLYAQDEVVDLPSTLMKYPINIDADGYIQLRHGTDYFPDTTARVNGSQTNIPNTLTL